MRQRAQAQAQGQWAGGYGQNQAEAGRVMQGQQSWTDPRSGQQQALRYRGGSVTRDPPTCRAHARDGMGQQYVQGTDGRWYPRGQGW